MALRKMICKLRQMTYENNFYNYLYNLIYFIISLKSFFNTAFNQKKMMIKAIYTPHQPVSPLTYPTMLYLASACSYKAHHTH